MDSAQRRTAKILSHLEDSRQGLGGVARESVSGCGCSSSANCNPHHAKGTCTRPKDVIRVVVTGGAGQIGYALLPLIAKGQMFGPAQPVRLHLLEVAPALKGLQGVAMELQDGAYDLLQGVLCTSDPLEAFRNADYAVLVGSFPRKQGMERKDLLEKNAAIFREQGSAMDKVAKKSIKVLVVGNPANTNCAIAAACAPSIPRENFSALTRLDMNRARALLASRLQVRAGQIVNAIIWGNHSSTQYPDVNHAVVVGADGSRHTIRQKLDNAYLNAEFIETVQKRGAAILAARGLSSAMSAANAVVDHMRDWILGSPKGEWVSMAVASDGSYSIPKGVIYSFPVTCQNGSWQIVQGLPIDEFSKGKMQTTLTELLEERDIAFAFLGIGKQ